MASLLQEQFSRALKLETGSSSSSNYSKDGHAERHPSAKKTLHATAPSPASLRAPPGVLAVSQPAQREHNQNNTSSSRHIAHHTEKQQQQQEHASNKQKHPKEGNSAKPSQDCLLPVDSDIGVYDGGFENANDYSDRSIELLKSQAAKVLDLDSGSRT